MPANHPQRCLTRHVTFYDKHLNISPFNTSTVLPPLSIIAILDLWHTVARFTICSTPVWFCGPGSFVGVWHISASAEFKIFDDRIPFYKVELLLAMDRRHKRDVTYQTSKESRYLVHFLPIKRPNSFKYLFR